jgi:hypothetical protein
VRADELGGLGKEDSVVVLMDTEISKMDDGFQSL